MERKASGGRVLQQGYSIESRFGSTSGLLMTHAPWQLVIGSNFQESACVISALFCALERRTRCYRKHLNKYQSCAVEVSFRVRHVSTSCNALTSADTSASV